MSRILIIGSNSFIGKNFICFSKFREVKSVSLKNKQAEKIDFENTDVVLHLAAIVHVTRNSSKEEYFRINRDLSLSVAKYAKTAGVKQFIFLSSIKVYGKFIPDSDPWNEESVCNPNDYYGTSKYEAEIELLRLNDINFTVSIIRTPIVYGEGVKANMLMLIKLVENIRILPFADIANKRSFTYIENLIGFIDCIIDKKIDGVFIVKDDGSYSTTELICFISGAMKKKIILFKIPGFFIKAASLFFPLFVERLYGSFNLDNSLTKRKLNFRPPYTTEEGIRKMIASFNRR